MPLIDTDPPNVSQVMLHAEMLRAYEAHLDKEFSSENMAFLRAVNALQVKAKDPSVTDTALKDEAAAIYDHYMKSGATREVNLKATNLNGFQAQMENLATLNRQQTVDMFAECHGEITGLISSDSFTRFAATKEFRDAAQKVESNLDVEWRIGELRMEADKARQTVGDRMKASVGAKTKAQELTEQADKLQAELNASRQLKPLDVPPTNTQQVIASTVVLAQQQRELEARQAAERQAAREAADRAREEAARIPPPPPDELDEDIPLPPPDELDEDIPLPPPELDGDKDIALESQEAEVEQAVPLAPVQVGHGQGGQPPPRVGPQVSAPPRAQVEQEGPQMEVEEMSMEEIGEINVGQGRERSRGLDGGDVGQTRGRSQAMDGGAGSGGTSVRDSLGRRDGPPKQGQGGPKVK